MAIRPRSRTLPRAPLRRRSPPEGGPQAGVRVPPEERVRRAGGPEDTALYGCACGSAFQAPVSASVSCPRCGSTQAW